MMTETRHRRDEMETLKLENNHFFNLLKSVYDAIKGSNEGIPIPPEIWDEIEDTINAAKSDNGKMVG